MSTKKRYFKHLKVPEKFVCRKESEGTRPQYRTQFMRDRDRILYSRAFRRLSGKTQVFLSGYKDHVRTRLTHTLEVAQIARTITLNLGLDESLAEAISLGHDLGHTPFGHTGEKALNIILNGCENFSGDVLKDHDKGFKHNLQSVRVAMDLEENSLNLTKQTLFGFLNHTSTEWNICPYKRDGKCHFYLQPVECKNELKTDYYNKYLNCLKVRTGCLPWSFEAFVVDKSDEIAQRHHDLEDALDSKIMSISESKEIIKNYFGKFNDSFSKYSLDSFKKVINFRDTADQIETYKFIKCVSRFIVNILVENLIKSSRVNLRCFEQQHYAGNKKHFEKLYPSLAIDYVKKVIAFDPSDSEPEFQDSVKALKDHLKYKILNSYSVQRMDGKGRYIIRRLFKAYLTNPQQLPDKTIITLMKAIDGCLINEQDRSILVGSLRNELLNYTNTKNGKKVLLRVIADHIAGMTDIYALKEYEGLYG